MAKRRRRSKEITTTKKEEEEEGGYAERSESQPPWPELSNDLLELILRRLPLRDYFRFASVCKSWFNMHCHSRYLAPPPHQLPWLLFREPSTYGDARPILHNIIDGRSYRVPRGADRVVSTHGYLIIQEDINSNIPTFFFLNPISGKKVPFPHYVHTGSDRCRPEFFFLNPISGKKASIPHFHRASNRRPCSLEFFFPNPIAATKSPFPAHYHTGSDWRSVYNHMALCTDPSMKKYLYSTLEKSEPYPFGNVVFFDEKFYALEWDYGLVSWDHNDGGEMERMRMRMDYSQQHPEILCSNIFNMAYKSLVSCKEGFLLVSVFTLSDRRHEDCPPDIRIYVFRPDFREKKWVRVEESLGGAVLFAGGKGQSFLVDSTAINSTKEKGRGDRVYFARPDSGYEQRLQGQGLGNRNRWCWIEYDLKDGSMFFREFPDGIGPTSVLWMTPILT